MITNRKTLLGALDIVGMAISKGRKFSLPILKCFRIQTETDSAVLTGTNLDQTIRVRIESEGNLDTVLDWKSVRDFLHKAKDATVTLVQVPCKEAIEASEGIAAEPARQACIRVMCGDQSMDALFLKPEEMPEPHVMREPVEFTLSGEELQRGMRLTSYAQSVDDSRYILNGILLEHLTAQRARKEKLTKKERAFLDPSICNAYRTVEARPQSSRMVATDGRRLASADIDFGGKEKDLSTIIPSEAVTILSKLTKRFPRMLKFAFQAERTEKPAGAKEAVTYDGYLSIGLDGVDITTKVVSGNYPNYKQVIPTESRVDLNLDRSKFLEAIESTMIKGCDNGMKFAFENHVVTLTHEQRDGPKSTGRASFLGKLPTREGEERPFHISFQARFMAEAIKSLISTRVVLRLIDELSPIRIEGPDDGTQNIVIMPMRTT